MTFDRMKDEEVVEESSSMLFNNDLWSQQPMANYDSSNIPIDMSLPAVASSLPRPTVNTTNPTLVTSPPLLDPTKIYHPEWGVIKDQDFHPLTLKHQRDLEVLFQSGSAISDFYFWQANLGGYCMADMVQGKQKRWKKEKLTLLGVVVSTEGAFVLERKIVEGAPHPGRRKKKRGLG